MKKKRNLINKVTHKSRKQKILENIKKNKICWITSMGIILAIIIVSMVVIQTPSSKAFDTSGLLTNQTIDNLEFKNASFVENKLTVDVQNISNETYRLKNIDVTYLDSEGKEITTIKFYISDKIEKNDIKQLVVSTDISLDNAKKIRYTINK